MIRTRLIGLTLLAALALGALLASAAQAEEAPYWTVKGTRLGAGGTHFIVEKESAAFVLSGGGVTITCTEMSASPGLILGSNAGESGTNEETLAFKECKVEGNDKTTECEKVTEPITTKNLKWELVLDKTKAKLLVLFQPVSGSTMAEINFPKGCKIESSKVTGSILAEALNEKEEAITTSSSKTQYKTEFFKLPKTQPVDIWLIKGGTGKEVEAKELEFAGAAATQTGTASVSMGVCENGKIESSGEEWSALA
jgi:hypothetical protein